MSLASFAFFGGASLGVVVACAAVAWLSDFAVRS